MGHKQGFGFRSTTLKISGYSPSPVNSYPSKWVKSPLGKRQREPCTLYGVVGSSLRNFGSVNWLRYRNWTSDHDLLLGELFSTLWSSVPEFLCFYRFSDSLVNYPSLLPLVIQVLLTISIALCRWGLLGCSSSLVTHYENCTYLAAADNMPPLGL